jgi:hypothetical protein
MTAIWLQWALEEKKRRSSLLLQSSRYFESDVPANVNKARQTKLASTSMDVIGQLVTLAGLT